MQQRRSREDHQLVEFPFYSLRNISSPEDVDNDRKILSGHAPASSILHLGTHDNVRDYLMEAEGRLRKRPTMVHQAMRQTLYNNPENFSVLNGGVVIVSRDYEVDEKNKIVRLLDASIINGSQTKGILKDYYQDRTKSGETPPSIHITYELIITEDEDLVAETSISRNFQNDVKPLSIAGRMGRLMDLNESFQKVYPELKLRQSETELSDDYVDTERLVQVMTALTPSDLWLKPGESENPNKTYTYSAKTKCLKDFQDVHDEAKKSKQGSLENKPYEDLYQFYLDIVPQAYELHEMWKRHQSFKGQTRIMKAVRRDEDGNVLEVPDGVVFPIFAALSAFVQKTSDGWRVVVPETYNEEELIDTVYTVYREIADHNPQKMGKSKACYSQLHQLTSLYERFSK